MWFKKKVEKTNTVVKSTRYYLLIIKENISSRMKNKAERPSFTILI